MGFVRAYDPEGPSAADVAALPGATLLEFGTGWCGHCLVAQPLLEASLRGRGDLRHLKVEDGRGRRLGRAFAVKLWPTLVLLREGTEVGRVVRPSAQQDVDGLLALLSPSPAERVADDPSASGGTRLS
ncbi:MAG TPA: thioredoxin family protein [Luteimonas sp.]|nr:thioredoxin family protein [Luteimonas sp.]